MVSFDHLALPLFMRAKTALLSMKSRAEKSFGKFKDLALSKANFNESIPAFNSFTRILLLQKCMMFILTSF